MTTSSPPIGRLYGVGLGPGDPDLLTVKAVKILKAAPVVAYFAKKGRRGQARAILESWLSPASTELALLYPMTTERHFQDPVYVETLGAFYANAAEEIAGHLSAGRDVALVCEGDPLFYGSFMHLYVRLKDRFCVEVVPGVTGMSGCWSAAKLPITWGDDVLSVLPGTLGGPDLARLLGACDAAIIIKLGANLGKVRAAILEAGRSSAAIYVEHGTQAAERIIPLDEKTDDLAPYFSMILIPGEGRRP
ncbi:precorrin-2 C20-methyltransferase [Methylocella silvestris BL2]|uniref:Precorrin-2 C20-methyltransferase n=1 Tax=Methylocella silvestris (strain DSM 15510 / CIP 108128 / LMG 27833 / NCIMB 13906 / BL2) TaxID=395965 RepID=B8EQF9_METSB|nr:precorrin-2 C(20)-methyltransferase [Methylocella silvestris]ACK52172.1 precorrin-2 C20-methyltransferase [Methylocella silvestris BL2]